jgi:hypothetical protein
MTSRDALPTIAMSAAPALLPVIARS